MKVMTVFTWLLLVPLVLAEPPRQAKILSGPAVATGKQVREVWVKRYTAQGRLGWMQTLSYEVTVDGQTCIKTVIRDHLRYLRSGDPYSEDTEQYSVETFDGTVVETGYRTPLGKNQDLVIRGRPAGKQIVLEVLDHAGKAVVYQQVKPWDVRAKGILYQDKLLEGKDLSVGKSYTVHGFLTVLNDVAPTTYTVLGRKQMTVAGRNIETVEVEQSYPKECYLEKTRHYLDPATGQTLLSTEDNNLFDMVSHVWLPLRKSATCEALFVSAASAPETKKPQKACALPAAAPLSASDRSAAFTKPTWRVPGPIVPSKKVGLSSRNCGH